MAPKGYKTPAEAVEGLSQRGFAANFELLNKRFQAVNSGQTLTADELTIVEHHRFEGVSDPDDMAVLMPLKPTTAHAEPLPMRLALKPS